MAREPGLNRNRIREVPASAAMRTATPLDDQVAAAVIDPDPGALADKRR